MLMIGTQTPLMIGIWFTMVISMLMILTSAIVINLVWNKSYKKGVFTTKKVTIFATFLAILLIQTLIDVYIPSFPGMPSFESMTTITIGFLFGPIEGIIFGWVADSFIVLMHGWTYQILPSLMMPMIGLVAGMMGMLYRNRNEFSKWVSITIFQVTLVTLMLIMLVTSLTIVDVAEGIKDGVEQMAIVVPISCSITILIVEGIFFYLLYKKVETKDLYLLTLILLTAVSERTVELIVRPFSQAYYYTHLEYFVEFYIRLLRSSYLIPSVTIASFLLIKTTSHILDYN